LPHAPIATRVSIAISNTVFAALSRRLNRHKH